MPCSEKRARLLLERGRAAVVNLTPFVIRLRDRCLSDCTLQPTLLAADPGSKETGLALMRLEENATDEQTPATRHGLCLFQLVHRGFQIRQALEQRAGFRRRRRSKNLRYRQPRFDNRTRKKGWLPPSLQHRVDTTMACRWAPVSHLNMELVRFDLQKMENPEISGVEYQQGTLLGYEVREYLLEKWGRECAYCGTGDTPLEIEHVVAKSRDGSSRVANLTIACHDCNIAKDNQSLADFFATDKGLKRRLKANGLSAEMRLARVQRQLKLPLRDAAAVNATRWALYGSLKTTGLPVAVGSGGRT
ncbi:RNA-guided endonuclease IscB, partial [Vreelandella rituensis]